MLSVEEGSERVERGVFINRSFQDVPKASKNDLKLLTAKGLSALESVVPQTHETVEKLGYQFEFSCWW
jgi:hypothetical protein